MGDLTGIIPPEFDWVKTDDQPRRFKLFRQMCELIFNGTLKDKDEASVCHSRPLPPQQAQEVICDQSQDDRNDRREKKPYYEGRNPGKNQCCRWKQQKQQKQRNIHTVEENSSDDNDYAQINSIIQQWQSHARKPPLILQ